MTTKPDLNDVLPKVVEYFKSTENTLTDEHKNNISIIMRQTNYTYEEAKESLNRNKSIEKCIEEYLGSNLKKEDAPISTNQAIYKSIRDWMS